MAAPRSGYKAASRSFVRASLAEFRVGGRRGGGRRSDGGDVPGDVRDHESLAVLVEQESLISRAAEHSAPDDPTWYFPIT